MRRCISAVLLLGYVCAATVAGHRGHPGDHQSIVAFVCPDAVQVLSAALNPGPKDSDLVRDLRSMGSWRPLLRHGARDPGLAQALGLDRAFVLELPPGAEPEASLAQLRALVEVIESASAEVGVWACTDEDPEDGTDTAGDEDDNSAYAPNDPLFKEQYNLLNSGQVVGGETGLPGADLEMLRAWELSPEGADVVVAVLDAGISAAHSDLFSKLVSGWNFVLDNDKTDDRYTSHGTHAAGIIAAETSNRTGIAGVARDARLMPVVVLNKYGFGNETWLAEGLVWAADRGAKVASVSLGFDPRDGDANDQVLRNAVTYATAKGMLICASSGNTPGIRIAAPARYPEVIAVGATDNRDELWGNTSTGPEMDIVAPGVLVWSAWDSVWYEPWTDSYANKTGTSQACPHVAGVAALLASVDPELGPADLRRLIERSAEDLGPQGWDESFGHGRVNAGAAVEAALDDRGDDVGDEDTLCIADFNNDGWVDSRDFVDYLQAFADRNWRADLADPKGVFNTLDLLAFLNAYARGCNP